MKSKKPVKKSNRSKSKKQIITTKTVFSRSKLIIFAGTFAAIGAIFLISSYANTDDSTLSGVKLDTVQVMDASGNIISEISNGEPAAGDISPDISGETAHDSSLHNDTHAGAITDVNSVGATTISSLNDLCPGSPQPRVPLEAHAWWFPTKLTSTTTPQPGNSLGHAHTITCFPYKQTITSENLPLNVNMMAHLANVPEDKRNIIIRVHEIQIRGRTANGKDILVDSFKRGTGTSNDAHMVCDFSLGQDCSATVPVELDLVRSPRIPNALITNQGYTSNGRKQLRIMSIHEVYDKSTGRLIGKMRAISRGPITLDLPVFRTGELAKTEHYTTDGGQQVEASGWFLGNTKINGKAAGGYVTPNLLSPLPINALPTTGSMTLDLKFDSDPCDDCITRQEPLHSVSLHLDPNFPDSRGTVLYRESFVPGTISTNRTVTVSWTDLTPGLHKIVVKLKQPMSLSAQLEHQSTNQGSLHIPFVIQ